MNSSFIFTLIIFLTSYILFILCFMYEYMKTKNKYLNKIKFLHTLLRIQNNEIRELKNKLKGDKNAKKETSES